MEVITNSLAKKQQQKTFFLFFPHLLLLYVEKRSVNILIFSVEEIDTVFGMHVW